MLSSRWASYFGPVRFQRGLRVAGEEEEPGDEELHEDGLDALMASMEQPLTITDSEAKETITGDGTIQIEGNGHQSNERGT
ncbi:unnamed protein product [Brassica oleracea var. botrytis]